MASVPIDERNALSAFSVASHPWGQGARRTYIKLNTTTTRPPRAACPEVPERRGCAVIGFLSFAAGDKNIPKSWVYLESDMADFI
jgi:hypothetical protein